MFRPERWLHPTDAPKLRGYMLTFGVGPRICVRIHILLSSTEAHARAAARETVSVP